MKITIGARKVLLTCVCVFCVFVSNLASQPNRDSKVESWSPIVRSNEPIVELSAFGNIRVFTTSTIGIRDLLGKYSLVRNRGVIKDLEFTSQQKTKIARIIDRCDSLQEKAKTQLWKSNKKQIAKISDDLQKQASQVESEIEKLLLPHQKKRLGELKERTRLKQLGVSEFLKQNSGKSKHELSRDERLKLAKLGQKLLEKLDAFETETIQKLHSEFTEILNKRQKEYFDKQLAKYLTKSFDVTFIQLSYKKGSKRKGSDYIRLFEEPVVYGWSQSGQLKKLTLSHLKVSGDVDKLSVYVQLFEGIAGGKFDRVLNLDQSQKQFFQEQNQKLLTRITDLEVYLMKSTNPWLASENVVDMQNATRTKLRETFFSELNPAQLKKFKSYVLKKAISKFGIKYALLDSPLMADELSDSQKNRVTKLALQKREDLEDQLRKFEQECLVSIIDNLEVKNRQLLRRRLGDDFKHGSASTIALRHLLKDLVAK